MLEVAPTLLGCVLTHDTPEGRVAVRLTEVEAYAGGADPGSHAFRGPTPRTQVMFGPPGRAYVYFTYGMHWCVNLVCGPEGVASAVLLRAGEVVDGVALARSRRPASRNDAELARGPARLTVALGVTGTRNGADTCVETSPLRIDAGATVPTSQVRTGPRVGLSVATDRPWRFWVDAAPSVSSYRPGTPRRPRAGASGTLVGEQDAPGQELT